MQRQDTTSAKASRARDLLRRAWLAAPVLCLVGLSLCLLLGCSNSTTPRSSAALPASCRQEHVPAVGKVRAAALGALRSSVSHVLPDRVGRLYEEGTAEAGYVWSDDLPAPPPVSPARLRPDGYEMRWLTPNGDEIVADAFVFATTRLAHQFLQRATDAHCRLQGSLEPALHPPLARNLAWVNPHHVYQADVYLARGRRVYRVGDIPDPRHASQLTAGRSLAGAFLGVDELACLLPGARCAKRSSSVPA